MANTSDEKNGTIAENELAQNYYNLVKDKLKDKIDECLLTNNVKKSEILKKMEEIKDLYIQMFNIQYKISQITPKTILKYAEFGNPKESNIYADAINEQAKNWLNRLSSTLNLLTIKASEFNEIDARRREKYIFVSSIITSAIIGIGTSWFFDYYNDKDLNNQTIEIKKHQDSITNKIHQEYILNFDTLKAQHQQQSKFDSIYNRK